MSSYDAYPSSMEVEWNVSEELRFPDITRKRRYRVEFSGQVDRRSGYIERWALFHSPHQLPNGSSVVFTTTNGKMSNLPPCPDVGAAQLVKRAGELHYCYIRHGFSYIHTQHLRDMTQYSIFLRGDDEGGDRLINSLVALQIPIVVGARPDSTFSSIDWLPFPVAVNWSSLVLHVDYDRFMADAAAAITAAMDAHDAAGERVELERQRRVIDALPDVVWTVLGSRVHENVLRQAVLYGPRCREFLSKGTT